MKAFEELLDAVQKEKLEKAQQRASQACDLVFLLASVTTLFALTGNFRVFLCLFLATWICKVVVRKLITYDFTPY